MVLAPAAQAQLSGSVGVMSNYLYRGVSLSADKPVARLALNYDGADGWFAGGQVVGGQLAVETHRSAQWTGYAGYAARLPSGLAWEAGATTYVFPRNPGWSYREAFVGLSFDKFGARLHYSPDYLGLDERSLYGEVYGGWQLAPRLQGFWRTGYYYARDHARSSRPEGRLGIATAYRGWQAQLSLEAAYLRGATVRDVYGNQQTGNGVWRHQLVLAVTRSF
jgi:uncharacterized protein (TIGR02001 family)